MQPQFVSELIKFSEGALSLAEQAVRERDTAVSKVAALEQSKDQVTLMKVASTEKVDETLDVMAAGGLVPPTNRQKLAAMLATHEGALEVVSALVFQSFSPSIGGEPVAPMAKAASVTGNSGDTGGELAMFAKLARDGFN
jgi:hypothetical protein